MERYILVLTQGDLDTELRSTLTTALKSFSKIPRHTFLSVLTIKPADADLEVLFLEKDNLFWKNCEELGDDLNSFEVTSWITLAAAINFLADRLPEVGQYFMDVLCSGRVFLEEKPEQKGEVSFFLERLFRWHNMHVVFDQPKNLGVEEQVVLDRWAWWLCGSLHGNTWPFPDLKLWHGSLSMSSTIMMNGFELIFHGDSEHLLNEARNHGYLKKFLLSREVSHVATSLEYLMDCTQMAIPPYLYSPIKFLLQIPEGKQTFEICHNFFEYFESRPTYCMLFALDFKCSNVKQDPRKFDFESWIKSFENGSSPEVCPQTSLPDDCPHFTFVMYYDENICSSKKHALVAHLLIEPGDLNLDNILPCALAPTVHIKENCVDLSQMIPRLDQGFTLVESPEAASEVAQRQVDPADWPERRYLLVKELKTQKKHSSLLDGLSPPTSNRKVIDMKLSDFAKYFDSSGVPKRRRTSPSKKDSFQHVISGGQGKYPLNVQQTFKDIQNEDWSNLLRCQYLDIYLNHSSWREDQEAACNRLKEQFVLEETSSSDPCSKKPWVLCALPRHKRRPTSKRTLDTKLRKCKSATFFSGIAKPHRSSPRKNRKIVGNSSDQVVSQPRDHNHVKGNESLRGPPILKPMCQISKPTLSRTKSFSRSQDTSQPDDVRRSPRFKQRQYLSSSNVNPKNSDDLSEKHKMKLREAVALALEAEGILLNSPSFKSCGRRLFNVCRAFVKDILGKGSTSALMRKIAAAHVKQVIEFENIKS